MAVALTGEAETVPVSVLVVEDDPVTAARISSGLHANRFHATTTATIAEGRRLVERLVPDLLVLDIGLPDGSGLDLIAEARERDIGILCVSARGEIADRLAALRLGADDYIVKPIATEELAIKLNNLYRRIIGAEEGVMKRRHLLVFDGWTFDPSARRLNDPDRQPVDLTPGEVDVLQVFLGNPGICLSRDRIIELTASNRKVVNDRAVDIMVYRLRQKIEADPKAPRYFITDYGVGYTFTGQVDRVGGR